MTICPITKTFCDQDKCGWWSVCHNCCSIPAIAEGIRKMVKK